MQRSKFSLSVRVAASALACSLAGVANAQQASGGATANSGAQANNDSTVGEIIVTAEKRNSTVQKTAMSISAISGRDLQARGITTIEDVARDVPGVSMNSAGPGQTEYEIRGISSSGGEAPTTGFYLDETPITPPAGSSAGHTAIDPDLFDLARVEVLRGPQGTLYGSGSEGGTIKLVTNEPNLTQFSGAVAGTASGTHGGGVNAGADVMLNVPIIGDKLAIRVVGTEKHIAGWIDRIVVPNFPLETGSSPNFYGSVRGNLANPVGGNVYKNVNDENLQGVRVSILAKPTDELTIEPAFFYQKLRQGGADTFDSNPGTLAHYQPFNVPEPYVDSFKVYSLRLNYNFPAFSVTSATAYWTRQQSYTEDTSEESQNLLVLPAFNVADGGVGPTAITELDPTRQFSQELRLTSLNAGPFRWIAGVFYSDFHSKYEGNEVAAGYEPVLGTDNLFSDTQITRIQQAAVFGNTSYDITSKLKATAGLRFYYYKSSYFNTASGIASQSESGDISIANLSLASAHGLNPMADLSYTATRDLLLYATAARGFREGDGQTPVPTSGPTSCAADLQSVGLSQSPTSFGPEGVWSYEAGEKAQFLDRRITLNADVFYEKISNPQQIVPLACGFAFTTNTGSAASKGTDIEFKAKIGNGFAFSQAINYTKATFTSDSPEANITNGESLPNVPHWTLSSSLEYTDELSAKLKLVALATNDYVGSRQDVTYQRNTLPSYDLASFRVGLVTAKWSAYLFANNIGNKRAELAARQSALINMPTFSRLSTNQPRTIGIDLYHSF